MRTKLLYAIIPTLFSYFLPLCYPLMFSYYLYIYINFVFTVLLRNAIIAQHCTTGFVHAIAIDTIITIARHCL